MSRFKLLDAQAALGFVVSQTTYMSARSTRSFTRISSIRN